MKHLFFLFLFCVNVSFAQETDITLVLKDANSEEPIAEAAVYVLKTKQLLISNDEGLVIFNSKGKSFIEITSDNYKTVFINTSKLPDSVNTIYMESSANLLDEIILTDKHPQDILAKVIKNSINKLVTPVTLQTYVREFYKKNNDYFYYSDGLINFQVFQKSKKITTDILVEQNRSYGLLEKSFDFDLKGYNLNNLVENYYQFKYISEFLDDNSKKKYDFQVYAYPSNKKYYRVSIKPLESYIGIKDEYVIIFDFDKKLIVEVSSIKTYKTDAENPKLTFLNPSIIYKSNFKNTYRVQSNDYYLASSFEEIGYMTKKNDEELNIEVKNYIVTKNFNKRLFDYNESQIFKEKTLINKFDLILTPYWEAESGLVPTKEEKDIIAGLKDLEENEKIFNERQHAPTVKTPFSAK